MKFLKDYDYTIYCHLGKSNIVANAFNHNSNILMARLMVRRQKLLKIVIDYNIDLEMDLYEATHKARIANLVIQPIFIHRIISTQKKDAKLVKIFEDVANCLKPDFQVWEN